LYKNTIFCFEKKEVEVDYLILIHLT